jgi:hypothetical protein
VHKIMVINVDIAYISVYNQCFTSSFESLHCTVYSLKEVRLRKSSFKVLF